MIHAQIFADQVRALYRQTVIVVTANCVNTALVSALSWGAGRQVFLVGWTVLVLLVSGARLWLLWSYRRATPDAASAPKWGRRFVWGSAASGGLWGGASAVLLGGADPQAQLVAVFFVGGMCAAAAGSLASHLPAFLAFVCPALGPLIWSVAAFGDSLHRAMAAVLVLYGLGLFAVARVNHRSLVDAFSLRLENAELLAALQRAQGRLEETNRTLEQRVAERGEALRKQAEALRDAQRLEAMGRLAGGVAHDFNNLLTILLANVSELLLDQKLDGATRSIVREMREAATRGADLVRQLLTFSRQQPTSPVNVDLNRTVRGMQKWLGRLIGDTLSLRVELPPVPLFVCVDPTQVEQVIVNLVTNARDAVAGGGVVTIETRDVELAEASGDLPVGRYALLSVTDTGMGMDSETRRRIFEPFFTTKAVGKGTGLGLATAHGIVAQAGGEIRVDSAPGQGSRFRVYLPLASAPEGAQPQVPTSSGLRPAPQAAPGATILLVEDEPAIRAAAQRILRKAGYHVLAEASAEAALQVGAAHPGPIDLLVTDVVMAGMSGPSLAAQLSPLRPEMRVLFISGHSGGHEIPMDDSEGRVAFLAKPFTHEALIARVAALAATPAPVAAAGGPAAGR